MKILMIGDVVGELGRRTLRDYLAQCVQIYTPDMVIVNGENAANNGRGMNRSIAQEFFSLGVHCITLGNHAWGQPEIFDFIDREQRIVRPANYPSDSPGNGYTILSTPAGKVAVVNLMGRALMSTLDCPFVKIDAVLQKIPTSAFVFVDMHAETTSEKQAMGWYLDGRASAVIGTHTHVQTGDARILSKGTGFLTDVGMVGPYDGILGMKREAVIRRYVTQLPVRFEVATGRSQLNAVYLELDRQTKMTKKIKTIRIDDEHPLMG
ncbi:TIGR00282 family metallophosphoesterase [Hazenella sp. IB182357]|uniref:TIGR00282 family metallophosphoesterase n=1 Tax=Polycladospora coralii TaxID=2771432 RepID=A0A926NAX8_9BACL|nr:TIGR00282 family metallophosphoesterase [Polycladospora coralii]MBD1373192.1 TIGR00282 family metallophosphoesterase [Polycladospora coralii]MBS7530850.1 TIGR00282 family metallophosphoesterase [Polycladospora coralii]